LDNQRNTITAVEELLHRSGGIDMSAMFAMIQEISQSLNSTAPARRTAPRRTVLPPLAPVDANATATYTPMIADYILKLQSRTIDYVSSHSNTLAAYIQEQRQQRPTVFMDEKEIWDIMRDIIIQVNQKCATENWSGEFSERISNLLAPD
jgi:hypothetical protein